ncbi:DUF397 domain-containing protein [Streptomyces sp. ST2-7A]|uniref:DUF397 domain-containing protein n=1 Tax=Streptomyces sp. ST2-7A TaxID=2907214 RepID=UPI001F26F3E7|nr:DUF397 domain-containing protein [Streptomyces sp. ST2-7A]MCE7082275.1 DUF397 domain-containing protein [Streptomyces sp. ST2-7A]
MIGTGWRRSSYSSGNGQCVEVAPLAGSAAVSVRDSNHAGLRPTRHSRAAWTAFLRSPGVHRRPAG